MSSPTGSRRAAQRDADLGAIWQAIASMQASVRAPSAAPATGRRNALQIIQAGITFTPGTPVYLNFATGLWTACSAAETDRTKYPAAICESALAGSAILVFPGGLMRFAAGIIPGQLVYWIGGGTLSTTRPTPPTPAFPILRGVNANTAIVDFNEQAVALGDLKNVNAPSPSDRQVLLWDNASQTWINSTLTASDVGAAAAGHIHSIAGDVTGTTASSTVAKVQGIAWPATTPTIRDMPVFDGTNWTFSQVLSTTGDLFYRSATQTGPLPIGTAGQVLKVVSGVPAWTDVNDFARISGFGSPTTYSSGSGTHSFGSGKKWALIEIIGGGGGGGGGIGGGPGLNQGAGGGGEGERVVYLLTISGSSAAYAVGAKGTGGASANDGTAGGDSSFGGITAKGGKGGSQFGIPGEGGHSGLAVEHSSGLAFHLPGMSGHVGRVTTVDFGASSYNTNGGKGGASVAAGPGSGGDGGAAAIAGVDGISGRVKVWEA